MSKVWRLNLYESPRHGFVFSSTKWIIRLVLMATSIVAMGACDDVPDIGQTSAVYDVPRTGQTTCHLGDASIIQVACDVFGFPGHMDGHMQAGIPWPVPRFTDHGNGAVTDLLTGLMWTKDANVLASRDPSFDNDDDPGDGRVNWQHALDYVAKLNTEAYLGHTDWRLPNPVELRSLRSFAVSLSQSGPLPPDLHGLPNGHPFVNSKSLSWSSTTATVRPDKAWGINFLGQNLLQVPYSKAFGRYHTTPYYAGVWPVRSGLPGVIHLPKTGQTTCYDETGNVIDCAGTGQDGEIQAGAAWPEPRFTDHGNGTVTDDLTGLMWAKRANSTGHAYNWQGTRGAINGINYWSRQEHGGYTDWRLPNILELASLLNYEGSPTDLPAWQRSALPNGHPFTNMTNVVDIGFGVTSTVPWWSSTSASHWRWWALTVDFKTAEIRGVQKGVGGWQFGGGNGWIVRGGTVVPPSEDTSPPIIEIPAGGVLNVPATEEAGALVDYNVTAVDNAGVTIPVMCIPPSGSSFPVGATDVTCDATDSSGNTATAAFVVIVTAYQDDTADQDGDGLTDLWETTGIDVDDNGSIDLNLAALGADPLHKDIFVEVDYMKNPNRSMRLSNIARDIVVARFASAPVSNPDGSQGIRLHIIIDDEIPNSAFPYGQPVSITEMYDQLKPTWFGNAGDRALPPPDRQLRLDAKNMAFHWGVMVDTFDGSNYQTEGFINDDYSGALGIAEPYGDDLAVAMGSIIPPLDAYQAEVFMHELGHNLGLDHGGPIPPNRETLTPDQLDVDNCKPNYMSIMNYTFGAQWGHYLVNHPDYSGYEAITLDENALIETDGIQGYPFTHLTYAGINPTEYLMGPGIAINWNGNGVPDETQWYGLNLNKSSLHPTRCNNDSLTVLPGYNDWANLLYDFRTSAYFAGAAGLRFPEELDDQDIEAAIQRSEAGRMRPTSLTAQAESASEIRLQWQAPAAAPDSIAGHRIYRAKGAENTWAMIVENTQSTATEYVDEGLEPETEYHYVVSTITVDGKVSAPSNPSSAIKRSRFVEWIILIILAILAALGVILSIRSRQQARRSGHGA